MKNKPIATLSLDLDNQWSYMKIHGDKGWETFPSYLDVFVPYVLKALDELNLKITFFIVGQDAELHKNHAALKMIIEHGHEIANHSFHHESWLHLYSKDQIEKEIVLAEENIISVTGQKPKGFRGPGFSWSPDLLFTLSERGYLYDASTLPTYIGPFARLYYFWTSHLTKEQKKERKGLFGSFKDGFMPLKPYHWQVNGTNKLLEVPVSTIPIFKVPFHLSYLLYISSYSILLMQAYLNFALFLCKLTGTHPSFLLHPLDLIGGDQIPELSFFPGMNVKSEKKLLVFKKVINRLKKRFDIVPMSQFAETYQAQSGLKVKHVDHQPTE